MDDSKEHQLLKSNVTEKFHSDFLNSALSISQNLNYWSWMADIFEGDSFLVNWGQFDSSKIEKAVEKALEQSENKILEIESIDEGSVSYQSVAAALDFATDQLDLVWSIVEHATNVMDSPELRKVYGQVLPKVTAFYSGISLRSKLWNVISALKKSEEYETLDALKKRHVDELEKDFLEHGAALPEDQKMRIREIQEELAKITQTYSENVLDSTNDWETIITDPALIDPFPKVIAEVARQQALDKGHGSEENPAWRFTLHAPSIIPFMKYMPDPGKRKEAWEASGLIGKKEKWDNTEIILKVLDLREQKASIMGFENFAAMILKRRMAKKSTTVSSFIENLHAPAKLALEKEVTEIREFRKEALGLVEAENLEPWDVAYWSEKLLQEKYQFDEEALRPYFSKDRVIEGMFELVEKVFGLSLKRRETSAATNLTDEAIVSVWDEKVDFYDVYDQESGNHLGGFYADWFPRESKRSGAWMDSIRSGVFGEDGKPKSKTLGILCGNMTPGSGDTPALLTHSEVETIFHEFGHLMHEICGEVPVKYLNGISVPWDFVEVPSQIMENWSWQRESLNRFARHYETDEPIPEELFQKMLANRNFQKGLFLMRQLSFGKMDLDLHTKFKPEKTENLDAFLETSVQDYRADWKTPSPTIVRRFGHLFSGAVGYAAGYYSYQWSEVLEADAFAKFLEEGIENPEVGRAFRKEVLAAGNRVEPMEAYLNFRGQKPTLKAYLERANMAADFEGDLAFG